METPVNLHQLQLFCCIVESGSYTQAAQNLYITQPALSLQIKSLENKLGAKLFIRKGNNIELTEAGQLLKKYAYELLDLDKQLRSSMKELLEGETGQISIGSNRPIGRYLLPKFILSFVKEYPKLELKTSYTHTKQIFQYVLNEKVNVGFIAFSNEQTFPTKIKKYLIKRDHWLLVCSPDLPWVNWGGTIRELLLKAPLIGSMADTSQGELIDIELRKMGLDINEYNINLRMDDIESLKMAIISKLGIGFLPRTTIEKELASGELIQVPLADAYNPQIDYYLIIKEDTHIPPSVKTFIDFVLETVKINEDISRENQEEIIE
ncbi:LysR family transcriptional regulator [Neobacillus sp. PS3-12]|uniref:LysR family transcriptional regulator n=1 Tax=Neobacillus sp. PS3-12 TaxID=3070677 RepID=UPI0027E1A4CA|nr:LysR family transcriptional regulator [Neobacillus sp. PS3-12]WML51396.1 LysR family transcriptional regulator [Neobacillus sp. PS3-12]